MSSATPSAERGMWTPGLIGALACAVAALLLGTLALARGPHGEAGLLHAVIERPSAVDPLVLVAGALMVAAVLALLAHLRCAARDRVRLAAALRENEALLSTVRLHGIYSATDRHGRIIDVNDGFCSISGYGREELIGQNHRIVNSGVHDRAFWKAMWGTIAHGRPWHGEICNRAKDGSLYWVDSLIAPFLGADGKVEKFISIRTDVSLLKRHEASLCEAIERAERASRAKSRFLATMSHEIRTPMNAIIGLGFLLERTPLDAEQRDFVGKIQLSSKSLLGTINDVLDLSKVEAGELALELRPFDPAPLLLQLRALVEGQADAKRIALDFDVPADLPRRLVGDETRLAQVLTNLLSNAVKFTERGAVRLSVRCAPADGERVALRFDVEDSGIGIPPELQARVFEPFTQADTSTTRRYGGTGLGLSIVKRLVELMGGRIALDSAPGRGSRFTVDLPLAVSRPEPGEPALGAAAGAEDRAPLAGMRVLVVDDSDINQEVARRILAGAGAQSLLAGDGEQALRVLDRHDGGIDVVLMDVEMPLLDGITATERLRADPRFAALPVVALTAGALVSQRQRALAAGMNEFVSKPFEARSLIELIARLAGPLRRPGRGDARPGVVADARWAAWPEIAGIDKAAVFERLDGDWPTFARILERLLDDCRAERPVLQAGDTAAALREAEAMHRLRGSSGNLGARELHRLSGEIERALRAGDLARCAALRRAFAAATTELEAAARAALDVATPQTAAADPGDPAARLEPAAVACLMDLFESRNLAALDLFEQQAAGLASALGEARFQALARDVRALRFDAAVQALAGAVPALGRPRGRDAADAALA